jgi:antitoxin component of RelBE/YafQ-DinJ toxin-antitoxin module
VFSSGTAWRKVQNVEQVAGGPWDRAGVDRETWYAVRMMAVAIRETVRLPIDPTEKNEALPADHERLSEYAERLVSAVEDGDPEIVAMLLRRQSRSAS